jgi:hypothetical protein
MTSLDRIVAMCSITQVTEQDLSGIWLVFVQPIRILHFLFRKIVEMGKYTFKKVFEILGIVAAFATDVAGSGLGVEFNGCQAGPILSPVAHFLQKKLQSVQAVECRTIFFMVEAQWLFQSNECDPTLMLYDITHTPPENESAKVIAFLLTTNCGWQASNK